jgi:hypothetical protein
MSGEHRAKLRRSRLPAPSASARCWAASWIFLGSVDRRHGDTDKTSTGVNLNTK